MSDLIEKVVDAMTAAMDGEDCSSHGMASAAIAAVAEWLDEHSTSYGPGNLLRKRLEQPK